MFSIAEPKHWKGCVVFMDDFYIDVQEKMRRVASVHLGKRASIVIDGISMRQATHEFTPWMEDGAVPASLKQ